MTALVVVDTNVLNCLLGAMRDGINARLKAATAIRPFL
jgi:hypothetical protein